MLPLTVRLPPAAGWRPLINVASGGLIGELGIDPARNYPAHLIMYASTVS
jgi:hypothetical protein